MFFTTLLLIIKGLTLQASRPILRSIIQKDWWVTARGSGSRVLKEATGKFNATIMYSFFHLGIWPWLQCGKLISNLNWMNRPSSTKMKKSIITYSTSCLFKLEWTFFFCGIQKELYQNVQTALQFRFHRKIICE